MIKVRRERSSSISAATNCYEDDGDDDVEQQEQEEDEERTRWGEEVQVSKGTGWLNRERRCSSTGNMREWTVDDLEDLSVNSWQKYHLRCFNVTSKGLVVRKGDIVRYRRIRSMSLVSQPKVCKADKVNKGSSTANSGRANTLSLPVEPWESQSEGSSSRRTSCSSDLDMEEFTVYIVGASNVGKSALMHQFTTSEHILNSKSDVNQNSQVTVLLDSQETRLLFREVRKIQPMSMPEEVSRPCAFVVVYSVTQTDSFLSATYILCQLKQSTNSNLVVILVGNKSDLVRSRVIDTQEGQLLACSYKVKFIETSVGIHYNVDELLVGILRHLRTLQYKRSRRQSKCMERLSRARSSIKRMFGWMAHKKDDNQAAAAAHSCDIFKPG